MISKKYHKYFLLALVIWARPLLASQQILDPTIYQSEINYLHALQDNRLLETDLRSMTQSELNQYINSLNLSGDDSAYFLKFTKNTYETPYVVFNAQLKNFFTVHNSRPASLLQTNAHTDPLLSTNHNIFANHSYMGASGQFYAEAFDFFSFDFKPFFLAHDDPATRNVFINEAYGSLHINRLTFDVGKVALHWGYGAYQPMIFGDDSEPFLMVRARNNEDIEFDGPLSFLGKIKFQMFFGWMDQLRTYPNGHMMGSTFSFQPTPRFNFHLSQTVLYGGDGAPTNNPLVIVNESFVDGTKNPANRNTIFGFRYRIPGIEMEPYLDVYVEDCCGTPPVNPRDMLNLLGVYMPPKDAGKKFDLAVEWVRTNYITYRHDAFTYSESKKIMGHPIGPDANGIYAVGRYFHSKKLQFENLFAYEIRGREGRALSNMGVKDIRTVVPSFQGSEQRYRLEQSINFFAKPSWKWTVHLGGEHVQTLGYQTGKSKWSGIFGLESAYNF